mmetsp:Transcript_23015/g.63826  ORF Transcript_23015/g.63826 Transcript_23015/m.63826 type:complete len:268 (+) Transcript_23015:240-1043(+)
MEVPPPGRCKRVAAVDRKLSLFRRVAEVRSSLRGIYEEDRHSHRLLFVAPRCLCQSLCRLPAVGSLLAGLAPPVPPRSRIADPPHDFHRRYPLCVVGDVLSKALCLVVPHGGLDAPPAPAVVPSGHRQKRIDSVRCNLGRIRPRVPVDAGGGIRPRPSGPVEVLRRLEGVQWIVGGCDRPEPGVRPEPVLVRQGVLGAGEGSDRQTEQEQQAETQAAVTAERPPCELERTQKERRCDAMRCSTNSRDVRAIYTYSNWRKKYELNGME